MPTLAARNAHLGMWFAPLMLGGWGTEQPALRNFIISPVTYQTIPVLHELVWLDGGSSPCSPARLAARLRDLPFDFLKNRITNWTQRFQAQCFSLQLDIDHPLDGPVRSWSTKGYLHL